MIGVAVMLLAHLIAVGLGIVAALVLGPGYTAGAAAMIVAIALLILCDAVHPPAVATALGFAFYPGQGAAFDTFLLALLMVAALVGLQRLAVTAAHYVGGRTRRESG